MGQGRGLGWGFQHGQCSYCILGSKDPAWGIPGPFVQHKGMRALQIPGSGQVSWSFGPLCRCHGAAAWGFEGWESRWRHANRLTDASRSLQASYRKISLPGRISSFPAAAALPAAGCRANRSRRGSGYRK